MNEGASRQASEWVKTQWLNEWINEWVSESQSEQINKYYY